MNHYLPHRNNTAKLLVSVQNAAEAELALSARVPWIDLKSPESGPLGMPNHSTAMAVSSLLADTPDRSVALGELVDLQDQPAIEEAQRVARLFPFAKVGLSKGLSIDWQTGLQELAQSVSPTVLIPVIYADFSLHDAPSPKQVTDYANENFSPFLLIDTYTKQGLSLLDFLPVSTLRQLRSSLNSTTQFVLAGSLDEQHVAELIPLEPFAIAVRGAVTSGERNSAICSQKLEHWLELISQSGGQPTAAD